MKAYILLFFLQNFTHGQLLHCSDAYKWKRSLVTGNWYYIDNQFKDNYAESKAFCRRQGGYIVNITSESEYFVVKRLIAETGNSIWVNAETRPEHFSVNWRDYYAKDEPDHSGSCVYLSASRDFKWKDTNCRKRRKYVMCEREVSCGGSEEIGFIENPEVELISPTSAPVCKTKENVRCVFPFRFMGRTFNSCTKFGDFDGEYWCSTNVNAAGEHSGQTDWGYCSEAYCDLNH